MRINKSNFNGGVIKRMTREEYYAKLNLEDISAKKVHEFQNVRTAARILYGAFDCGDINDDSFREANRKLEEIEKESRKPKSEPSTLTAVKDERSGSDLEFFIARVSELRKKAFTKREIPLRNLQFSGKILLIDDECKKVGWNVVFDAVFGANRMIYHEQTQEAREFVDENADSLSLILLDLRLKDENGEAEPEIGLKLLKTLKENYLDLPILVFSGVDETFYTRECLQAGAADYYVKETTVRDRVKYYQKFKAVIREAVSNPEYRKVWRQIKALPKPNHHLLKAYFFLTTSPDDFMIKLLFSDKVLKYTNKPSIYNECVLQCALAVESWMNKLINSRKKMLERKPEKFGIDFRGKSVGIIPVRKEAKDERQKTKLQILSKINKIDVRKIPDINELFELRNDAVHDRKPVKLLNQKDALRAFDIALSIVSERK